MKILQNYKLNQKLLNCLLLSIVISLITNFYLFKSSYLFFLGNIQEGINLQIDKIIEMTLTLFGETGILTVIFYWSTKKIFK